MSEPEAVVTIDRANVVFGDFVAVHDLSLQIRKGERVAILGQTGAGKSTLLNLLIGNLAPTSGSVRVAGVDPYHQHRQLQGVIGMAFQAPRLLPWRTALKNVKLGLEILGRSKQEQEELARKWLEYVHLAHAADLYPSQLSGGMRQRVSLARAFAIEPELMLLDESFSALDEVTAATLRSEFLILCKQINMTAIIVTHNIEEAFILADRVILLGRPAKILAEFNTSECPVPKTIEFLEIRNKIHGMITANTGEPQADLTGASV